MGRSWFRRAGTVEGRSTLAQATRSVSAGRDVSGVVVTGNWPTIYQNCQQACPPVAETLDSLPPVPAGFTGRQRELEELLQLLAPGSGHGGVTSIAGMGGVGKTSLALVAARRGAELGWFDVRLFLDLHGYDAFPVTLDEALDALLRALGTPASELPTSVDERLGLYRVRLSRLAEQGRRVLIVADNVSTADQVRLLVPNDPAHRLLVTSRHTLTTLNARLVDLDVLQPDDAVHLLDCALRTADRSDCRITDDPEAAHRLAARCARLPLALQISAALLIGDRDLDCGALATAMSEIHTRLEQLDDGERAVRSSFQLSYQGLTPELAQTFRQLACMMGPDFGLPAAARLLDLDERAAQQRLATLVRAHLLERGTAPRRWRFHDLMYLYANEQLVAAAPDDGEPWDEACGATTRLVRHYLRTATDAESHLQARRDRPAPGTFTGLAEAMTWLDTERANLIIAVTIEACLGVPAIAVRFAATLGEYFERRHHLSEWIKVTTLTRDSARKSGDRHAEASASNSLGYALHINRQYAESIVAHREAIALFQAYGDPACEAAAWNNLGLSLREAGRLGEAIGAHRRALVTARHFGDRFLEAQALNNLGWVLTKIRRHEAALRAHHRAIAAFQRVGGPHSEANAWSHLGHAFSSTGRHEEAAAAHRRDLTICDELGDELGAARALGNLGAVLRDLQRYDEALDAHRQVIRMFQAQAATFDEAKAWVHLAIDLRAAGGDPAEVSRAWSNAADCYANAGAQLESDQCRRIA